MVAQPPSNQILTITPIGVMRCEHDTRAEAPRQPAAATQLAGIIELYGGKNFEHALEDIAGWERLWVIFWFDRNTGWRPKVLPPRSGSGRKGVFATRSPHRPNPLGLSALRLERVEGLRLHVRGVDLLDGTPVLDIKPYVAYTDAWPDARSGWLTPDPVPEFTVEFSDTALGQLAWIAQRHPLPLRERIAATLALGPQPHPYRRIRQDANGSVLAVRDWRIRFAVAGARIHVLTITSGYRPAQLASPDPEGVLVLHREFLAAHGLV
ncbi:MAG: tRNA (N6-threonylcarbamoyladenosine(37)-N6)-methyltransferase TrmO [Steroidobacteraceae bacterium]